MIENLILIILYIWFMFLGLKLSRNVGLSTMNLIAGSVIGIYIAYVYESTVIGVILFAMSALTMIFAFLNKR